MGSFTVGCVVSVSPMLPPIPLCWRSFLKEETRKPYYRALDTFLERELAGEQTILPVRQDIFNALASTSYDQVRVVLIGQDPYPTPGYAHGLCFPCNRLFVRCLSRYETSIGSSITMSDVGSPIMGI